MTFAVGDRVVVTEKYRGAGCNHDPIGYYGHVAELAPHATPRPMVMVSLKGRIDGLPVEDHYIDHGNDPFPLYEFEIEHAD